jgi:molybdenum cofactor biosynthesis protein B
MSYQQHIESAHETVARCAVLTLSDTRTETTDDSGRRIMELVIGDGHQVVSYRITREDPELIEPILRELIARPDVDVVLSNGGTGIGRRDNTLGAVERLIERPLPGFGELFRMLSFEQIGSGAMLSRAIAGLAGGKIVFAMPGSPKAVELAMTKLILPELRHLLHELRR